MLRESEFLKNKKCRILLGVELILLIIGIAALFGKTGIIAGISETDRLMGEGIPLSAGVYTARIYYETEEDGISSFGVKVEDGKSDVLKSNSVGLYAGAGVRECQFYLLEEVENLSIFVEGNGASTLDIEGVELESGREKGCIWIFLALLGSLLVNSVAVIFLYHQKHPLAPQRQMVLFGVSACAVLASLPVMTDYALAGADLIFHLGRIEALAESFLSGGTLARIESIWLAGHGYANSIFYGDTFLLFPVFLRILGFPLTVCYQFFVASVNVATALIAYFSFKKCFHSARIGLMGCILYTLSPYRVYNVYNRAAVGEYTAMIFLPLLACGFCGLLTQDVRDRKYWHNGLILAAGFSGIIQSHALSCEMAGGFTVLLCILMWKKVFRRKTLLVLSGAAVTTALLNAWFLVPFLDLMTSDSYYFGNNVNTLIQSKGVLPAHIFYTLQAAGNTSDFAETGMVQAEPVGVGAALLLGALVFLVLRMRKERLKKVDRGERRMGDAAFLLGCIALFMSTCYFPWNYLSSTNEILASLIGSLQFPTRLTAIATVCLTFVACVAGKWLTIEGSGDRAVKYFLAGSVLVSVLFAMYQLDDILYTRSPLRIYSAQNMGHSPVLGAEYLPADASMEHMTYHDPAVSRGTELSSYEKENLQVTAYVETDGRGGHYVEFPMLYYKGYHARNTDTGEALTVVKGDNADVRVLLPENFKGSIQCGYTGMWYWHLAEAVSAVTLLGLGAVLIRKHRKNH